MTDKKSHYDFYKDTLWTGRIASFTKSIDSNLKLLRVILLTKGSTIMEFSKVLGKGLLNVNERMDDYALPKNFKLYKKTLTDVQRAAMPFTKIFLGQSEQDAGFSVESKGFWGDIKERYTDLSSGIDEQGKGGMDEDDLVGLVNFKFEETQLYNLRTLSLNQKIFVTKRLENCVKEALKSNDKSSKVALIRKSFQYIATDIEIVQRAIVQRVHEVDDNGKYAPSMQASALQITDMLALLAVKPFQHLLPTKPDVTPNITPITFFSQETHIRSLPYCDNVVLIGIRYDQVLQDINGVVTPPPFEILAIPHEIGHYIYQRANLEKHRVSLETAVKSKFSLQEWSVEAEDEDGLRFKDVGARLHQLGLITERHEKWCEEIFSDICGCIVAGPLVALSLLSILASRTDAANNDYEGEHPAGKLRPFILKAILDQLKDNDKDKYPYETVAAEISTHLDHTLTPAEEGEIEGIKKIIGVFMNILLDTDNDFKLWSSPTLENLTACEVELEQIRTWSEFEGLEPIQLDKSVSGSSQNIGGLVEEWKKKGPVTIGGH